MAIGPVGASPLPVPSAAGGPPAPSRLARALQDAFGFRGREAAPEPQPVPAEPRAAAHRSPEEAERRQLSLEEAAEQIRRSNPNAPRGTIVNLVV